MRFLIRPIVVIMAAASVPAFAQDLTILSKTTTDQNPPETTTSYLSSDHVRMASGRGAETILDLKAAQMTTLDNKKKTYYVTTKQDMEQAAAKMKQRTDSPEMKRMQEEMKDLPPEQRKQMEAAMGGLFGSDVKKTGTTRKIAGYGCENWEITMGEVSKTEECLTSELQLPVQAWEMYRSYADSLKAMMAAMGPMAQNLAQMQEKFKNLKGYPMATDSTVNVMGHSTKTTMEVTEVKRGPIPASAWEIPAGYKKVDNPMLKALESSR